MAFEMQGQIGAQRRIGLSLFIVFICLGCVPALLGSQASIPLCGQNNLEVYLTEGSCSIGGYTLKSFSFSSSGTGDASLLSPSQIMVDPSGSTLTSIALNFSTDGGFHVAAGQTAEYIFHWNLDPFFPTIDGPDIDLGPNDPVTLTGEFCGDGILSSAPLAVPVTCTGSDTTGIFPARLQIVGTGGAESMSTTFPSPVFNLDSRIILDITGPGSVASLGSTGNITPVSTPEPATWALSLAGLAVLPWLRKKLRANPV